MPVNKIRRNGSYAPLSAHAYKDDALAEAGESAELLFYRSLSFCADVLRDGFISETQLVRFPGAGMKDVRKRAERLVEVGLWVKEGSGYRVVAWLKWNRSRSEIEALQEKDAGRKGRPRPRPNGEDAGVPAESERSPNGIQPDSNPRVRAGAPAPTPEPEPVVVAPTSSAPSEIDPGVVVGAWVEAYEASTGTKPSGSLRGQAGREAKSALGRGIEPSLVLEAAQLAAGKGFATIDRECGPLAAKRRGRTTTLEVYDPDTGRTAQVTGATSKRDPKTGRAVDF